MGGYSRVRSTAAVLFRHIYRPRSCSSSSSPAALVHTASSPIGSSFSDALDNLLAHPRPAPPAPTAATGYAFPWNLLNAIYIRGRFHEDALLAADKVVAEEWWMEFDDPATARVFHRCDVRKFMDQDLYVGNVLLALYVNSTAVDDARNVFDGMRERDEVTFNHMLLGYAAKGMWGEFLQISNHIPQGLQPNTFTWNLIIAGYFAYNLDALRLISEMSASGSDLDPVTVIIGLNACSRVACLRRGRELHGSAIRMHCDDLDQVMSALIKMYALCDRTDCTQVLCRNIASSNSWITCNEAAEAFLSADRVEEAFGLLGDMVSSGNRIHDETLLMMASLCARFAKLSYGRQLHGFITTKNLISSRRLWNALVDMYAKLGMISDAQRLFHVKLSS